MPFELRTPRLLLRDIDGGDFEAVHAFSTDLDVVQFMDWGPNTEGDTRDFLERAASAAGVEPRTVYELVIVELSTSAVVGTCGLYVDESRTQGMIGYCLAKRAWRRGIATEAARALTRFAFDDLSLHRVWAGCDPANVASRHVLEKVGMRQEGHQRESVFARGVFQDRILYGVLQREWKQG